MSEEEVIESEEETVETTAEEEAEEEPAIEIDINAALLEAMVKRTEILEKLARGEYEASRALHELEAVVVPTTSRRRRARKK